MIRPLRTRHRAMWVGLLLVLPALFVAGLAVRRSPPTVETAVPGMITAVGDATSTSQKNSLPDGSHVTVHWYPTDAADRHRIQVELSSVNSSPEVLAYWTPGDGEILESLPVESRLLGVLHGRVSELLDLPAESTADEPGRIVIYLLSQGTVLGVVELRPPTPRDAA